MSNRLLLIAGLTCLGTVLSGCRLTGRDGPISASLAKCREYSQEGVIALERGQADEARELLAKAVESCPEDAEARQRFAEALWSCGRRDEAVDQLAEAIALLPKDAGLRVRMAQMRLATGQPQRARSEIDVALDIEPELGSAWAMRARVQHAAGDAGAALADYHRALGYAPEDRELLLETAELYRELNQPEKALALLHRLIDTYGPDEEPPRVVYLEGLAYAALGRCEQAAERYAAALARGRQTPELLYQLAVVRWRAGRPREASAAAEAALRLEPGHLPSRQLIEQLGTARPQGDVMR